MGGCASARFNQGKPVVANPPLFLRWNFASRATVFVLAAASIWCLLAEFYGLCSMRLFTFAILLPATAVLIALAIADRYRGEGMIWRGVVIGAFAGLFAVIAYDIFRIPFVVAAADKVGPDWLRLPLFKVFPRFGALILGEPFDAKTTDSQFTLMAHLIGWLYHFSNGITFGVMYVALIGNPSKHSWFWAVLFATFLEFAMLFTPYTGFFGIGLTTKFVIATMAAHTIFGIVLGLLTRWIDARWTPEIGQLGHA
jgi:hypothetical protein